MLTIFVRTIRDRKISLAVYCLSGVALLWMYVALFPSIQKQAESFNELIKNYPEGFLKAFGVDGALTFSTLESFLALEQFSFVWPLLVFFLLMPLAASGLAGEIERGTAEIMLSRHVSRRGIFAGRYLAGAFTLVVFTIFSIFGVVPLAELHNIDYVFKGYVMVATVGFLFALAVFSMTMMFSAVFSERGKVYMASGGILIVMYVLNLISALQDNLSNLKYLSFFHYFDPSQALTQGSMGISSIAVFILVVAACTVTGLFLFSRRDIGGI